MNAGVRRVERIHLLLILLHTPAAPFIWGPTSPSSSVPN
jgi:hypothetical protein